MWGLRMGAWWAAVSESYEKLPRLDPPRCPVGLQRLKMDHTDAQTRDCASLKNSGRGNRSQRLKFRVLRKAGGRMGFMERDGQRRGRIGLALGLVLGLGSAGFAQGAGVATDGVADAVWVTAQRLVGKALFLRGFYAA